jgi:hypothetical protein
MSVSEDLPRANSRRTSIVPGRGIGSQPSPQAKTWPRRRCIPHPRPRVAGPMAETSRSTLRGRCNLPDARDLKTAQSASPTLRSQSSRSATPRVTRREQVARCTWLRPPSRSAPRSGRHGGSGISPSVMKPTLCRLPAPVSRPRWTSKMLTAVARRWHISHSATRPHATRVGVARRSRATPVSGPQTIRPTTHLVRCVGPRSRLRRQSVRSHGRRLGSVHLGLLTDPHNLALTHVPTLRSIDGSAGRDTCQCTVDRNAGTIDV